LSTATWSQPTFSLRPLLSSSQTNFTREGWPRPLNALLDDPARRAAIGAAGRQRVREEFSAELMARRTLEVYREVVSGAARRTSY
jgi:hypothetical protein